MYYFIVVYVCTYMIWIPFLNIKEDTVVVQDIEWCIVKKMRAVFLDLSKLHNLNTFLLKTCFNYVNLNGLTSRAGRH